VKDVSFNLAHLNFAFEYYKIAKFMPLVLKGQQVTPQQTKKSKIFYSILCGFNIFFPIAEAVTIIWFNSLLVSNHARPDSALLLWLPIGSKYGNALVQLISGTLLILAVLKIQDYLRKNGSDQLNVRMLVLHSVSFGLYMLSIIFYQVFFTIAVIEYDTPNAKIAQRNFDIANAFYILTSFTSQALLCVILNRFGSREVRETEAAKTEGIKTEGAKSEFQVSSESVAQKTRKTRQPDTMYEASEAYPEIEVQSLDIQDIQAELQARIWNQFIRRKQLQQENENVANKSQVSAAFRKKRDSGDPFQQLMDRYGSAQDETLMSA
jgi:hypothetical protein